MPLETYMVVNFRTHRISRGARKLIRTSTLIIKKIMLFYKNHIIVLFFFLKKNFNYLRQNLINTAQHWHVTYSIDQHVNLIPTTSWHVNQIDHMWPSIDRTWPALQQLVDMSTWSSPFLLLLLLLDWIHLP